LISSAVRETSPRRFLAAFAVCLAIGFGLITAGYVVLDRQGLLPAPPLVGTQCIDEKLEWLRQSNSRLEDSTLLAIGSSATWRNLDLRLLEERLPGEKPINAASCFLHINQTAYLTEFLLESMPRVNTVLVVVAPRDFENCHPESSEIFDPRLARAYIRGGIPHWVPYITGFSPFNLPRQISDKRELEGRLLHDDYGSAVFMSRYDWWPELVLDGRCYDALAELERLVVERGAALLIAIPPPMPRWAGEVDPRGTQLAEWRADMQASLDHPTTLVVDGWALNWDDSRFADPVHLIYPHHAEFTQFIVDQMAPTVAR
jgi:hypothetical protein